MYISKPANKGGVRLHSLVGVYEMALPRPLRTRIVVTLLIAACAAYEANLAEIQAYFTGQTLILAALAAVQAACLDLKTYKADFIAGTK